MKLFDFVALVLVINIGDCNKTFLEKSLNSVLNKIERANPQVVTSITNFIDLIMLNQNFKNEIINEKCCETTDSRKVITRSITNIEDKNKEDLDIKNSKLKQNTKRNALKESFTKDDPSIYMTTPQLIAFHGYPSESHTVTTEDGYILTVHRVPYSKNHHQKSLNKTVLIHHGLLGSSADWVITGPEKGLAYILSEAGYDVWLANARGNTYSKAHVSLNVNSPAFWNFTFHELGEFDLPAVIDYIMSIKGEKTKLDYIGHSMGGTALLVLLSTKTQYNHILNSGIGLAPVATLKIVKTPLRHIIYDLNVLESILKTLRLNEIMSSESIGKKLRNYFCERSGYAPALCEDSFYLLCGWDVQQFNRTLLPLMFNTVPAGTSSKLMLHFAQEHYMAGGRFQMYDYGLKGNLAEYGNEKPPEYPVHEITLPMTLISGKNDLLVSFEDVRDLYNKLPNAVEHYVVPYEDFSHIDFLWAIDAPHLLYDKVLSSLEAMQSG